MAIGKTLLWTEKYRARKFTDLVGDERTHRSVLRWLKAWDSIVFPHQARPKAKKGANDDDQNTDRPHRKILLLTGPPGLGKTTLALICARQAGYEVQEINASDERSGNVVKGRIRDMVATENVKSVESGFDGKNKRAAKPVCVIVDEVDGVVSGSTGSGEGGFIKALVDLLVLDQRNSNTASGNQSPFLKKKKGDRFKMLRPLILICNDVYHPSLRLLRQGTIADIVHIRKPPIQMVASRLQAIFAKEGIECDGDGVRALCEATWGISNRKEDRSLNTGAGDGDMRSILVTGEWVAGKLKAVQLASKDDNVRLSKRWLTDNVFHDLAHEGGAARNLGRGGSKEVAERVFLHNAGFPSSALRTTKPSNQFRTQADMEQMPTSRDTGKKSAMQRLMQMIHASGEDDRIMSDIWTSYPAQPYQDDTILTKPSQAYDWLHFHNICSGRVHAAQEWELLPYLSYPILAFHELFAGNSRNKSATAFPVKDNDEDKDPAHPLTTIRAAYLASEAQKSNHATLTALHSILSHSLQRSFRGPEEIATDLVPYVLRILNPDVKPVVVGGSDKGIASVRKGSEKELVNRAVQAMLATGVTFDKTRIDFVVDTGNLPGGMDRTAQSAGFVYRMEPPVDHLGSFGTATKGLDLAGGKVRYAVRQVLDQEHRKEVAQVERNARQRRAHAGLSSETYDPSASTLEIVDPEVLAQQAREDAAALAKAKIDKTIKRDFFGRQVVVSSAFPMDQETARAMKQGQRSENAATGAEVRHRNDESGRVWVTYHEGYSNAVRKGITMAELLGGF
ncbi:hypothetical protein FH972_021464 [Carpinus fangiana]|uniref:AAA+ ATPase domain-containing protein n=1 Tax=Carpinus fangiana TaxID=176857 RepID=A0A5N6KQ19_9ROSI|nr:hypothetical protein FH972_021464 [Carpinus fangiana]